MRLTEPLFSIAAVGLILLASAAVVPVIAYETHPELSAVINGQK